MEGYNCDVSPLPYGICPGAIVDLPWTHAKARAQPFNESLRYSTCCSQKGLFSSKTRGVPHVRDHVQPGWPSHNRTNGESILFSIDSSPLVPSWHLGKPTKDSAISEGPTSHLPQRGQNGKLNWGCTVHEGFDSDCMEGCRKEDFSKTSAVHKGEFRNFFNIGVAKVCTFKQSTTVAHVRSDGYEVLRESECVDSRRAKTTRC